MSIESEFNSLTWFARVKKTCSSSWDPDWGYFGNLLEFGATKYLVGPHHHTPHKLLRHFQATQEADFGQSGLRALPWN